MDDLRAVIALLIFIVSCYLTYDLLINGFDWFVCVVIIAGFWMVHLLWPRKIDSDSAWYDWLEVAVDLPYRSIALILRAVGRSIKRGGEDISIDL